MFGHLNFSIFIFLVVAALESATGLEWKPFRAGDQLPLNPIWIDDDQTKCVGRVKTSNNKTIPAEISELDGVSKFRYYTEKYYQTSEESEILTIQGDENCSWKPYDMPSYDEDYDSYVVRAGSDTDGNLILVARAESDNDNMKYISSLFLPTRRQTHLLQDNDIVKWEYLSCKVETNWLETSPSSLPKNAVFAGKSKDGYDMYVARVKQSDENLFTGYVMPELNSGVFDTSTTLHLSSAEYIDPEIIERPFNSEVIEVLVGEPGEYSWVHAKNNTIPDYAVVNGRDLLDFVYIARVGKSIIPMTQYNAVNKNFRNFDILVKNKV